MPTITILRSTKKLVKSAFLFSIFLSLLVSFSHAANIPKVTIYTEQWPPYNYVDNDGAIVGLSTEVVHQLFKQAGIDYEIKLVHWAQAMRKAQQIPNTFVYSIYPGAERLDKFQWICPLVQTEPIAFYRLKERTDIELQNIEDAERYVVGVIRGGDFATDILSRHGLEIGRQLVASLDEMTNVRNLLSGRIDLIVQEGNAVKYRLAALGYSMNDVSRLSLKLGKETRENCLATGLKTPHELVKKLQISLQEVKSIQAK